MVRVYTQTFGVVGAILERNGKILLVKEAQGRGKGKWSQPAGWIDVGENPIDAVKREVEEETGFLFTPTEVLGIYSLYKKEFLREGGDSHGIKIIFTGNISQNQEKALAEDITEIGWFLPEEIEKMDTATLRDLDIKKIVKDYLTGKRYPLE